MRGAMRYAALVLYSLPKPVFLTLNFQLYLRKQKAFISQVLIGDFWYLKANYSVLLEMVMGGKEGGKYCISSFTTATVKQIWYTKAGSMFWGF